LVIDPGGLNCRRRVTGLGKPALAD